MKRTAIFLIVFAVFSLISMSLIALENTIAKPFRIETKSSNSMEIKFRVPEFEIEKELADGRVWDKIKISDSGYLLEIGKPELPIITTTVAIPNHGQVEVEIVNTRTRMIKHIIPYPSQDGTIDGTPKNLSVNQAFYRSSEIYPAEIVRYSDPQIFRDFRIVTIQCQPFAWNAQTQELEVREEIDFRLRFNDEPGINELNEGPLAISPSFAKIYEANILNFDDFRSALVANQPPRYLIIHGNYNDATFQSRINEFSLWKKQKGADVRLVSTAVAGTTTTQIKAFIQNIYNDVNARPDFIIIIGDTNGSFPIPTWPESFSSYSGQGDYPYQHLAGNDYVGDVFIGRISAESNDDLNKLLSKVYFYEKNINVNNAQWLNKMLLVGDTSPSGQSTVYANKYIKELGLIHNPDYIFTELYSDSPSAGDMNNAMNSGVGFFNYRGYIGMSGWSPSSALVNGAKLPHAVIITCSTGNFAGGSSATTEAFTRLGTATVPAGAVTAIGMYTSGTHTMFNNALNMGIFTGIFTHKMRTMGEALLNGKVFLHEVYNQTHSNSVKYFAHWCNLIGDPTMEVFITIPKTFNANIPASLPLGTSNLDLVVTDQNSFPVQNASVTVTQNSIILARGYTDATGAVFLFFNLALTAGPATVVISSHDFKPLVTAIEVNTNGSLVAGTSMIDDDSVGSSIGNGNFSANSGETLEVLFSVRNTTSEIINNVTGSVSTTSPYINILNSNVNFLSVDSGTSNYSIIPVLMQVSPTCPHNTNIKFIMNLTDSADSTYNFPTYLNVTDAFMNFISYQVTDTNNQVLDPNESVHFKVTVKNNGTVPVNNLNAQLITLNDLVLVQDNLGFLGNILVGAQANTAIDDFLIMGRPQLLPGTLIPMRIKLFNDAGFLQWVDFTLTTGVVTSTDPLGPDVYGYVIYDITDTAYEDCPTYSWIGIAPAEGGQGTAITLNDVGVSNDEGDPVGATSMAVVQLPFPFKFYGQTYNQITVSSNGFIVMGVAENANYRNFRLPGTVAGGGGAPSPLIAPFWDDLSTSGGGAFRWYDSINHLFVIEWYQFKNGYVLSAQETFQVILFDPVYYPTSTGDGPIKIQYHTFNNVDTGSTASEWSGRYCTIGIQNYDQTIGLEYSYNNTYPTAAAPLSNQKALFITTAPLYHYTPHLMYDSSFILDNNNNVLEPAETVDLYVNLINLGAQTAQFINTSISSASPYVTIINNTSTYPEIDGDAYEHNITPFRFSVSPNCPDKQILPFTISITTDLNFWQRTFNLIVEKPNIIYHSYLVNDQNGNNNGVTDPGETVALAVMIKNNSLVKANNLTGTLETAFQGVTIGNSTVQVPGLASNDIIQIVFNISLDNSIASNTNIPFNFNMTSTDAPSISKVISMPCGTGGTVLDFEANNGYLESLSGWEWGTPPATITPPSGSSLWCTGLTGQYGNNAMYILKTPQITLGANAMLSFKHYLYCQNYFDGGNVSISTNNGVTWILLYPVGGYNTSLNIYSLGEVGYTNLVNWTLATFDLSAYSDSTVVIRWRFGSNATVQNLGWYIDDMMISGYYFTPGIASGNVTLDSDVNPSAVKVYTPQNLVVHPNNAGDYKMYLLQGTHSLKAGLLYHIEQSSPSFTFTNQNTTFNHNFNLSFLANPTDLTFSGAVGDSIVFLTWNAPVEPIYPILSYKIYRRLNDHPYQMVGQSASASFNEELNTEGMYFYYVRAVYSEGEGAPSNEVSVIFPFVGDNNNVVPVYTNFLHANYPNPFGPATTIAFSLAKAGPVSLKIYNAKGQLVKTLLTNQKSAGKHSIVWDGRNNENRAVATGLYFYRLETPGYAKTRKMMMLK